MKKRRSAVFFRYLILSILGLEWWRLGGEGGVGFVAVEVVFEDDVAVALGVGFQQIAGGWLGVLLAHGAEVVVRANNRLGIAEVEAGKALEECERVVEAANEQRFLSVFCWQILVQKEQIVAEIEVGFAWVALWKATTTEVIHLALGNVAVAVASVEQSPAKVNFLHVGKEVLVESTHFQIHLAAHHEACAGSPKDVGHLAVVLSVVFLHGAENASTAVGITVLVDVATSRTGIFKHLSRVVGAKVFQQFGLHCTHIAVRFHVFVKRLQPVFGRAHIAVEQHCVFVGGLCYTFVVALGKAPVFAEKQRFHFGKFLFQHLHALVGAAVVGNDYVGYGAVGISDYAWQIAAQQCCSIPVEDNDGYRFHALSC